jgi:DNA invertase Pin-like site-specific DNA recombinase
VGDRIGYARVSTSDQNPDLQHRALTEAGCIRVFTETASGALADRPVLKEAKAFLRPGDTFVVWKLDRLGRSLRHLIDTVNDLGESGIGFLSLSDGFDTSTAGGRMIFHVMGALAQFERDLIRERTNAGLEAARARGRNGGRPPKVTPAKRAHLFQLYDSRNHTIDEIAHLVGISKSTIYRELNTRAWERKKAESNDQVGGSLARG